MFFSFEGCYRIFGRIRLPSLVSEVVDVLAVSSTYLGWGSALVGIATAGNFGPLEGGS